MPPKPRPKTPRAPAPAGRGRPGTRLLVILAAGLLVGIVAIVLGTTLGGSKKSTATAEAADLSSLAGVTQQGLILGKSTAKLTLTEYVDTSCPICRDYELATVPSLVKQYVRTGKVKIELRPVGFVGPASPRGRDLVLAAAEQNKAFQLAQTIYRNQGDETTDWLSDDLARAIAAKVPGLDVTKLMSDASGSAVKAAAARADAEATADGIRGTPTFYLTTQDGKRHLLGSGSPGLAAFQRVLDRALKG